MSYARTLSKLRVFKKRSAKLEAYSNNGLPVSVTNIGNALDYIISSIFPNARESVSTELDLPLSGNELNDYRIVINYNSTGQAAGFRWTQLEGQSSPQWNLVQQWDSFDSILQQWQTNSAGVFVPQLGSEDVNGTIIHGSTLPNGNLTLSANSGDGSNLPENQSGHIQLFGNTKPTHDNIFDLGKNSEQFKDIYLKGNLSNGTETVSVLEAKTAYDHSQITDSNPHNASYDELRVKLGNLSLSGDIDDVTIDLSTSGAKTANIAVKDDSHSHTKATLTDFDANVYDKVKSILQDNDQVSHSFDDINQEVTKTITVNTSHITDIGSPIIDKILTASADGLSWRQSNGAINLLGDIAGSASYNSASDKTEITTKVENVELEKIDLFNPNNYKIITISDPANGVMVILDHGLNVNRLFRVRDLNNALDGAQFEIIEIIDANQIRVNADLTGATLGPNPYIIPNGSQILFDSFTGKFRLALEETGLSHHEIQNLSNDDHLIYNNINGRGDGTANIVTGGELANANLYLQSTSDAIKGNILLKDNIAPEITSVYNTGVWNGISLGSATRAFKDLHIKGELKGGRAEQVASLPIASASEKGRIVQMADGKLYINKGTQYKQLMEMPDLVGQKYKSLVVNSTETGFEFKDIEMISNDSLSGELTGIGTTVKTITAPANAFGIYIQVDEENTSSLRFAWGSSDPTVSTGYELLQGQTDKFLINTDLKVIAENGSTNKLSYTWILG